VRTAQISSDGQRFGQKLSPGQRTRASTSIGPTSNRSRARVFGMSLDGIRGGLAAVSAFGAAERPSKLPVIDHARFYRARLVVAALPEASEHTDRLAASDLAAAMDAHQRLLAPPETVHSWGVAVPRVSPLTRASDAECPRAAPSHSWPRRISCRRA